MLQLRCEDLLGFTRPLTTCPCSGFPGLPSCFFFSQYERVFYLSFLLSSLVVIDQVYHWLYCSPPPALVVLFSHTPQFTARPLSVNALLLPPSHLGQHSPQNAVTTFPPDHVVSAIDLTCSILPSRQVYHHSAPKMESLPKGLVSTTRKVPAELDDRNIVDTSDVRRLWKGRTFPPM